MGKFFTGLPKTIRFAGLGLFVGLFIYLLAVHTPLSSLNDAFEWQTYDLRSRLTMDPETTIEEVVIIDIDTRTISRLGRFQQWSRSNYIRVLDALERGGANGVAFDLLFDPYHDEFADSAFAYAIGRNGHVGIAVDFAPADSVNFIYAMDAPPPRLMIEGRDVGFTGDPICAWSRDRLEANIPGLANHAWFFGFVNAQHDHDGVIRRAPLMMHFADRYYPSLSFAMAAHIKGWDLSNVTGDRTQIVVHDSLGNVAQTIPLDNNGRMLLHYRGPFQTFRYISLYDVIEERIPPEFFRDKVVFVGASYAGLADLKPVPVQSIYAGVEIHATSFHNLMVGDPMKVTPQWISLLLALILTTITGMAVGVLRVRQVFFILLFVVLGYSAVALYVFASHQLVIAMVLPLGAMIFSGIASSTYKYVVEEKDKRFLRSAFTRYVSDALVTQLVQHPDTLKLGGDRRVLTLMFSDIRSFTTLSEQLDPERLGIMLNRYLTEMTDIIFEEQGTLDKYIGDAVVAIFGAPLPYEDHPQRAIDAAIRMQERILELHSIDLYKNSPFETVRAGIGVHTGPVMVGNFGSEVRFDYTAIGDSMNLASRLEGLTKYYRCKILCSSDTLEHLDDTIVHRRIDRVKVKGKHEPVDLIEILGYKGKVDVPDGMLESFEQALKLYLEGDFSKALDQFRDHLKRFPGDGPALSMAERQQEILDKENFQWEGAWNMMVK